MTASTKHPERRLYHVLHECELDEDAGLPDQATLDDIASTLGGVDEFLIDRAATAVVKVACKGEPNSITHEDIGRLVVWADHVYDKAMDIVESAARVSVAARESYAIAEGYQGENLIFNDHGHVVDHAVFESVLRRFVEGTNHPDRNTGRLERIAWTLGVGDRA